MGENDKILLGIRMPYLGKVDEDGIAIKKYQLINLEDDRHSCILTTESHEEMMMTLNLIYGDGFKLTWASDILSKEDLEDYSKPAVKKERFMYKMFYVNSMSV